MSGTTTHVEARLTYGRVFVDLCSFLTLQPPLAAMLPKNNVTVRFPPTLQDEMYQLLELPPDIFKAVEGGESVS